MKSLKLCRPLMLLAVTVLIGANAASAQTVPVEAPSRPQPSPTPQATASSPSLEKEFFRNILRDQRAIITAPLHLKESDARFLLPLEPVMNFQMW